MTESNFSGISDDELRDELKRRADEHKRKQTEEAKNYATQVSTCLKTCGFTFIDAVSPEHKRTSCNDTDPSNPADCLRCLLIESLHDSDTIFPYNYKIHAWLDLRTDVE